MSKAAEIDVSKIDEMNEDELEDLGKKKKRKTKRRKPEGIFKRIITVLTIMMSLYHLYSAIFTINPTQQRAIHLMFVLTLVYLLYPATSKSPVDKPSTVDYGWIGASLFAVGNLLLRFNDIARTGGRYTDLDIICGYIIIAVVAEAARRAIGKALPIMAGILILYGLFGRSVPGPLRHSGFSIERIMTHLTLTTEGVFGQILGVSSTYIYLFILFGAFLGVTGMSSVFNDIALSIAGGSRGGPAKVSVLASGMMGSISGSTSANVVTTGAFTIPLMQKTGYKDYFASAVEAAASAGGQIMPPVMGSAAFIIADSLGIPFVDVLKAALLPAVLYYFSLWVIVDLRARKEGIYGVPKANLPKLKTVLLERGHLLIPLVGIVYMLIAGYNAMDAALIGIVLSVGASFLRRKTWIKPIELVKALEAGAVSSISVAAACAIIGVVVGMVSLTGAILSVGAAVLNMSGGLLPVTLILTMFVAIIMGMGLPTTACYVLTSTIAAPAIVQLGIEPLQAHLFVFYYGILSTITPPVATGSYAAAGLSGADVNKTGWTGIQLAIAGFIIPYMFIYSPSLLMPEGIGIIEIIMTVVSALVGVIALGLFVEGFLFRKMNVIERALAATAAVCLIYSGLVTDVIGYSIIAYLFAMQYRYSKKAVQTPLGTA